MDKNQKENIDILGVKWLLAPGGKEIIDRCQNQDLADKFGASRVQRPVSKYDRLRAHE